MNPPSITIELLSDNPDLIASLAELRWRQWADHPGREDLRFWVDTTAREAGRDAPPVTFVAVDGAGRAVGGVGLAPSDPPQRTDRGPWVVGTIVHPDHRGHGIGAALMTHLQQWASRTGIPQLWVATGEPAVDFYRSCGWAVTEVITGDNGAPTTILTNSALTNSAAPRPPARIERLDPPALPAATGNFTHGTLVTGAQRVVFVSGQPPWGEELPADFESQCRLAWRNVLAVLAEAGMGAENLVKVTTFLSGREHRAANSRIREEMLGEHRPALTVIICDIYAEEWLVEIDAVAAA